MFKWLKEKFKTVYCNECANKDNDKSWLSGKHHCYAFPYIYVYRTGSLTQRPTKKNIKTHCYCENVKKYPWCSKYKAKDKI